MLSASNAQMLYDTEASYLGRGRADYVGAIPQQLISRVPSDEYEIYCDTRNDRK